MLSKHGPRGTILTCVSRAEPQERRYVAHSRNYDGTREKRYPLAVCGLIAFNFFK